MPRKNRQEGTRAPNRASSIYQDKHGKWHGRVTVGTRDDGKLDRRHVESWSRSEVTKKVRRLEHQRDTGRKVQPGKPVSLIRWLEHWLDNVAAPSIRYKTFAYYKTAIDKYLAPMLGSHRLDRLEPEHIERTYRNLRQNGTSSSTLQQVHRTLRASLNEAVRREKIGKNPALIVKAPSSAGGEITPLTVTEAKQILDVARTQRNGPRWAIALSLGLRQGEALGLKWSDLDREESTLTVRRALQRQTWQHGCDSNSSCARKRGADCPSRHSGGLVEVKPKSSAGRRLVHVPKPLLDALSWHEAAQANERLTAGDLWHDEGWIFATPDGRAIDPRVDYQQWRELLRQADVRRARLHDARHTAATMLLVLNVPRRAVMDIMGWSEISMTNRYQHVPDDFQRDIASSVGRLLWEHSGAEDDDGTGSVQVPV